jgi:hypothetical protein
LAEVRRVHQAEVQLQLLVTLLYRRMRDEEATRRIHAHESKQVLYSFNCWPQMAVKDQRIAKLEEEVAAAEVKHTLALNPRTELMQVRASYRRQWCTPRGWLRSFGGNGSACGATLGFRVHAKGLAELLWWERECLWRNVGISGARQGAG